MHTLPQAAPMPQTAIAPSAGPWTARSPVPRPGPLWGSYPERPERHEHKARCRAPWRLPLQGARHPALAAVQRERQRLERLDGAQWDAWRQTVQARLGIEGLQGEALAQGLAVAADAARRSLGKRAFETQLLAALHMLDQRLVEMATGEGKTLATALAAATAALAGMPVHVLTANDYLVQRDATDYAPLYERLGLQVAAAVQAQSPQDRRLAYAQDVVLVTAQTLVFDYLRDRMEHPRLGSSLQQRARGLDGESAQAPLLRGLCMALIDEADSVLIDEALMPLVLSREQHDADTRAYLFQAWSLAGGLEEGMDYELHAAQRQARLTPVGRHRVAQRAADLTVAWQSSRHREHAVTTALAARCLYHRDRDYVLRTGTDAQGRTATRIAIVDAVTGRVAEGRRWSRGLHALVALKEGCPPEPELETLSQITFQRFFRRYHRLGGLSGTLRETRAELRQLFGLPIAALPSRLPGRRQIGPMKVFAQPGERWTAVARRCAELKARGRPVLVGTDSVADARAASAALDALGLAHTVLDARQDAEEAAIVARAGQAGAITVATHMAGRGTDIALDAQALAAGGLHVLCCQLNPSRRLDRQLVGRAGRQGQPGSAETWLCLDAPRLRADALGRAWARALAWVQRHPTAALNPWVLRLGHALLQWHDEARMSRQRVACFRQDCEAERGLLFAPSS